LIESEAIIALLRDVYGCGYRDIKTPFTKRREKERVV
jgi:hypothetical protein